MPIATSNWTGKMTTTQFMTHKLTWRNTFTLQRERDGKL